MEQCVTASSHPTLTGAKLLCLMLYQSQGRENFPPLSPPAAWEHSPKHHTLALPCTKGQGKCPCLHTPLGTPLEHPKGSRALYRCTAGFTAVGCSTLLGTLWQQLHLRSTRPAVHCLWQEICTWNCRQWRASSGGMRSAGPPQHTEGTEMGTGRTGRCL